MEKTHDNSRKAGLSNFGIEILQRVYIYRKQAKRQKENSKEASDAFGNTEMIKKDKKSPGKNKENALSI